MNTTATALHDEVPETPAPIECVNPATGESLGTMPAAAPADVTDAVARARAAQQSWAHSSFSKRRAVLRHLLDLVLERVDELCEAVVTDSGKTYENALLGEVMPVSNKIRWVMKNGEKHLKPERVPSGLLAHKKGRIEYRPLGVVACIVPWNYPFQNIFGSFVAPLMAGNAVVLKPSEELAWSTQVFQKFIDEALQRAGLSTDLVQILNGRGDVGAALVRSAVDKILFIGSGGNGQRIIEGSAENLTPVTMELGGKDPLIVCDDAHLEQAVHATMGGCFINLGQNCVAAERIIVEDGIFDAFVAEVERMAGALRQGVPTEPGHLDVGSITTPGQVAIIDELVNDAIEHGARALVGGQRPDGPGNFYPPTILVDVTSDMRIAQEEVFGPVMLIMRVADDAEAIALANNTDLGLQSSVFSRDRKRAERLGAALQAGATCINDYGLCYLNQDLPFGGVKGSGFGRMNGRDGLRDFTNAKAVLTDRLPLHIPARLYPVTTGDYERTRTAIRMLFARRLADKCIHLWALVRGASSNGS